MGFQPRFPHFLFLGSAKNFFNFGQAIPAIWSEELHLVREPMRWL